MANPIKVVGKGVVILGVGAVFLMSVIGALSLDILLLYLVAKDSRNNNSFANMIVTFWLWDRLISNSERFYQDIGLMIAASPFITAITVGLSFALGAPEVGMLLIAGWVASFTIILAGAVIHGIGEVLEAVVDAFVGGVGEGLNTANSFAAGNLSFDDQHKQAKPHAKGQQSDAANNPSWQQETHYPSPVHSSTPSAPPPSYEDYLAEQSNSQTKHM